MKISRTREEWQGIINAWASSGKKVSIFCREENIKAWQFHYWKKRLTGSEEKPGFTELKFSPGGSPTGIWFQLGNGIRLNIDKGYTEVGFRLAFTAIKETLYERITNKLLNEQSEIYSTLE